MKRIKHPILGSIALLSICMLASCRDTSDSQGEPQTYPVLTVKYDNVNVAESYSASIQGRQDIEIYPQVAGTISNVCVKEGQDVKEGQLLFVIDQVPYLAALRTATANVHSAQAQMETARLDCESKKVLLAEAVISDYDYLLAENALAVAEANVEQAKAQELNAKNSLSYTEVRSPSDGIVGTLPYRKGALVGGNMSQPLTTISDNKQMYVYFSMTENQLRVLMNKYGSLDSIVANIPPVRLRLNDDSLYDEPGHIESISGVINRQTGTVSIRSVFPNTKRQLLSGGIGNVVISYPQVNTIAIPQTATVELQDRILVYKLNEDNTVTSVPISVNKLNDGKQYIVLSGLKAGDKIVSEGVGLLQDGMSITVKEEDK